jgi:hypothetical protein
VALEAGHAASAQTRWDARVSFAAGDSTTSRILREQGVSLPRVATRSVAAEASIARALGPRGTLRIEGRFNGTDFRSAELEDGASARVRVAAERETDPRSTVGLAYAAEHVLSRQPGAGYLTHFTSAHASRRLSRRAAVLAEGGISLTHDPSRAGLDHTADFFGGASLAASGTRSQLIVFVRREVAPAFGTGGSRLDLRTGLRATLPLGSAWTLEVEAAHVNPRDPEGGEAPASSDDVFARFGRDVGRWMEVRGETRYRRRGPEAGQPRVQELQAGLVVWVGNGPGGGRLQ